MVLTVLAALSARERCAAFRGVLVVKDRVMALVQMYCASWLSSLERVSPSTAELLLPGFFVRTRRKRQVGPCLAGCGSLAEEKKARKTRSQVLGQFAELFAVLTAHKR